MRLFLIRHGESVDNVAGVYAGSRDSALTSHGVVQAQCTAGHLAGKGPLHHVFSSDQQRAVKTAEAIVEEQKRVHQFDGGLVQLACLREKDFGSLEGVKYGSSSRQDPDDSETKDSMRSRVEEFVDQHLVPLLRVETPKQTFTCAVVAHGVILTVLWSYLIDRVRQSLQSLPSSTHQARISELPLGAVLWFNASITQITLSAPPVTPASQRSQKPWGFSSRWQNSVVHLKHLKKTRGGIGSAAHDDKQKTLTSFFSPIARERRRDEEEDPPPISS